MRFLSLFRPHEPFVPLVKDLDAWEQRVIEAANPRPVTVHLMLHCLCPHCKRLRLYTGPGDEEISPCA